MSWNGPGRWVMPTGWRKAIQRWWCTRSRCPTGVTISAWTEEDRTQRYVAEFPSYARILEYARSDIRDILFDLTVRDKDELVQWEVFSAVRVDDLYPDHTGIKLEDGDGLEGGV